MEKRTYFKLLGHPEMEGALSLDKSIYPFQYMHFAYIEFLPVFHNIYIQNRMEMIEDNLKKDL